MTITNESNASETAEAEPAEAVATTIEIGCPNCGNRYRLAIADSTSDCSFHCTACDSRFTTHPVSSNKNLEEADQSNDFPSEETITPEIEAAAIPHQPVCTPPPHAAPSVRLWPWLIALLLIVAAIGGWTNQQAWSHTALAESIHAWWAPQRSIGWQISQPRPQWINRQDAPPLLAIGIQLHNEVLFDRAPPPLLLTTHIRGDNHATETQLVTLHQQPSLTQLEQPSWQPPTADRTPIPAGAGRSYTIVLNHPPKLLESVELTLN